jgi:hypothetical protein
MYKHNLSTFIDIDFDDFHGEVANRIWKRLKTITKWTFSFIDLFSKSIN